jgi:hypothetical protein
VLVVPFPDDLKVHRGSANLFWLCSWFGLKEIPERVSDTFPWACSLCGLGKWQGSQWAKEGCNKTQLVLFFELLWERRNPQHLGHLNRDWTKTRPVF